MEPASSLQGHVEKWIQRIRNWNSIPISREAALFDNGP